MSDHETEQRLRGHMVRGVVSQVHDDGAVQTIDVTSHDGVQRTGIEVHMPYGLASLPPDQPLTVLAAIGGDQGAQVAWPLVSSAYRWGNLLGGQTVIYDSTGTRLQHGNDGTSTWASATLLSLRSGEVTIVAGAATITVGPAGASVTGNLAITGTLAVSGVVSIGGDLTVGGKITAAGTVNGR